MNPRRFIIISCVAAVLLPLGLHAQAHSKRLSSAVDAQGVRHQGSDYSARPPWIKDAVRTVKPEYPYEARARRMTGSGLFRITLDVNTGSVLNVVTVQSTGAAALDESAIQAFRKWRWKPGKWKAIDVPVTFTMFGSGSVTGPPLMEGPRGAPSGARP